MNKGRPGDVISRLAGAGSLNTVTIIILLAYLLDVIVLPLGVQKLSVGTKYVVSLPGGRQLWGWEKAG